MFREKDGKWLVDAGRRAGSDSNLCYSFPGFLDAMRIGCSTSARIILGRFESVLTCLRWDPEGAKVAVNVGMADACFVFGTNFELSLCYLVNLSMGYSGLGTMITCSRGRRITLRYG